MYCTFSNISKRRFSAFTSV